MRKQKGLELLASARIESMEVPLGAKGRSTLIGAILVILLIVLGTLQYIWIDRVSRVERDRRQSQLAEAAFRMAQDFDTELARLLFFFQSRGGRGTDLETGLRNSYQRWSDDQAYGGLLNEMWLISIPESGQDFESIAASRYQPSAQQFESADLPRKLAPFEQRLQAALESGGFGPVPELHPFEGSIPALIFPAAGNEDRTRRPLPGSPGQSVVVLILDEEFIREVFLPELTARHFGLGLGSEFRLWVKDRGGERIHFQWPDGQEETIPDRVDVRQSIFFSQPPRDFIGPAGPLGPGPGPGRGRRMRPPGPPRGGGAGIGGRGRGPASEWELLAVHRTGSLAAAVNEVKFRTLFITTAILLILAASIIVMLTSAQRARELARQQMDFVASISHELRTPLTAIRSAAQNLQDGVISSREDVSNYGRIIGKAESRLHEMVMQVLDFARFQSAHKEQLEHLDAGKMIRSVVDDLSASLLTSTLETEIRIQEPLPPVTASRNGLRRILENLIQNAIKYSPGKARIEIDATSEGRHVIIRVKDHGKGMEETDLRNIFKPFYRGKNARDSQIQGSGLGLSLVKSIVESFGGKIGAQSTPGKGSIFSVQLNRAEEKD